MCCERGERTQWSPTVRTYGQLLQRSHSLWTFLENPGLEPTNVGAEGELRQVVIQLKITYGAKSKVGGLCRTRHLLTVCASLRQQRRDVWSFLRQAWIVP
jgi:hypothetical protein